MIQYIDGSRVKQFTQQFEREYLRDGWGGFVGKVPLNDLQGVLLDDEIRNQHHVDYSLSLGFFEGLLSLQRLAHLGCVVVAVLFRLRCSPLQTLNEHLSESKLTIRSTSQNLILCSTTSFRRS